VARDPREPPARGEARLDRADALAEQRGELFGGRRDVDDRRRIDPDRVGVGRHRERRPRTSTARRRRR
jgi:hypothetical protein